MVNEDGIHLVKFHCPALQQEMLAHISIVLVVIYRTMYILVIHKNALMYRNTIDFLLESFTTILNTVLEEILSKQLKTSISLPLG